MKLQILINHYLEDKETITRFLQSLNTQTDVKFEAIIASDGGNDNLKKELLSGYNFPITYAYLPHSGICHTRNILLDKATADYVMFCDMDDKFIKSDGLISLIKEAEKNNADIVCSQYLSEFKTSSGKMKNISIEYDALRVHGKIFRREFLVENKIRYPDEIETSGDMAFLWLAFLMSKKTIYINNPFYLWAWNDNSVTRKDEFFTVNAFDKTLRCYIWLAEELKKRKLSEGYKLLIATLFASMYIYSTHPYWKKTPDEAQQKANKAIEDCIKKYYNDYKILDEILCKKRYEIMLEHLQGKGICGTFEGLMPWIEDKLHNTEVIIIGYGVVGHNLANEFAILKPDIYDKYLEGYKQKTNRKYRIAFVCVDTPHTKNGLCDTTEVKNAILENNADIFVLKSTILPGTVDKLKTETGKSIIFIPEYHGGTHHCNNYEYNYTILGGDKECCKQVIQLLQNVYDASHHFYITNAKTAELVKYMENCYLATKVSFCNQFFNLAEELDIDYEELRELFILDPRVNPAHTFVYREHPYWNSRCLVKDMEAIADTFNATLLQDIIKFNEQQKEK